MATVLYVGPADDSLTASLVEVFAPLKNCRLERAADVQAAIGRARPAEIAAAVFHVAGAREAAGAIEFLNYIANSRQAVPILVISEALNPELLLRLMQAGAVECLPRPLNLSRLAYLVDMLTVRARLAVRQADWAISKETLAADTASAVESELLFHSPAMRTLIDQLRCVAPLDSTVLLTGETGTGKTSLSRLIHQLSARAARPFVVAHCGALSPTLIESELFGHVRGAFTGADRDHTGKFAQVEDGTLLLDDVDLLPSATQAKLLRAVEDRLFEPVGSNRSQPLRARLVAATNSVLADELAAGRFRADLYYRLNVIELHVPPLRERREVIARLAEKFLARFASQPGIRARRLSSPALAALCAHDWPGNVRELRNAIERAAALCAEATIELAHFPQALARAAAAASAPPSAAKALQGNGLAPARAAAERERLEQALARSRNNRSQTALDLGISRVTLYKKLRLYGMA